MKNFIEYVKNKVTDYLKERQEQKELAFLSESLYHRLCEFEISELELPISTLKYVQGVEWSSTKQFFIYLKEEIEEDLLEKFTSRVRQYVKAYSSKKLSVAFDCVVTRQDREPEKAISIRICTTIEMLEAELTPAEIEVDIYGKF
ncbi:hypothetical protein AB1I63_09035 [Streptococcus pneumoniae]